MPLYPEQEIADKLEKSGCALLKKIFYQAEGELELELPGGADMKPPKGFIALLEAFCLLPFDKSEQV